MSEAPVTALLAEVDLDELPKRDELLLRCLAERPGSGSPEDHRRDRLEPEAREARVR